MQTQESVFHSRDQHLCKFYLNKRKCLHKKRVQLKQDWFGTPTWPPFDRFYFFYLFSFFFLWSPLRHMKTLYTKQIIIQYNTIQFNTVKYNVIEYTTLQYNVIQYNTKH